MPTYPFSTVDFTGASDTGINGVNAAGEVFGEYSVPNSVGDFIIDGLIYYNGIFTTADVANADYTNAVGVFAAGAEEIAAHNSRPKS